ncbi:hypothetical protein BGZ60DRAFT_527361 [Tricladium varicosporioides]|nr:hypothetical protein BGZ60DRAFT_527361 [Hymenoscyphus varicosporioides]
MWKSTITPEHLRQSIRILKNLNEVPEPPKEHILVIDTNSAHQLSIERENEIASNLAFLSAASDDNNRVMAVCIEEHPSGDGITIRIASNSGDFSEVINGFKRLATILEKATGRENPRSEDLKTLLQQIVAIDRQRILSRLRSQHANSRKATRKQAIITQLNQVIHDTSVQARSGPAMSHWKAMRDGAETLQVLFTKLESIRGPQVAETEILHILEEIVKEVYEFNLRNDLSRVFQNFSGNPSLIQHLPRAIGKLARYYSIASELICAARDKKCRVLQNVRIKPFEISIATNTLNPAGRVHAEIQLLFFYELCPDIPRPRIIASSKSACYLCNLFFHLHGGFLVPRTHGRIYEKWVLPDWLDIPIKRHRELAAVLTRFKRKLDDEAQSSLRSRRKYSHPNESVLLPLAHWPSSSTLSHNQIPMASASKSKIIPLTKEGEMRSQLSPATNLPLTPPTTPPKTVCNTKVSHTRGGDKLVPDTVSLMAIRSSDLPYSQKNHGNHTLATRPAR